MKKIISFLILYCIVLTPICLAQNFKFEKIKNTIDDPKWTQQYDKHFQKNSKRYFGVGFNWKWWKAQSITESALNKDAESWVGAKGLMQVMPGTYKDIQKKVPDLGNINEPRWNIAAGLYYNKYLFSNWTSPRPFIDRMSFIFASYNGGMGNILKAQKHCNKLENINCNLWEHIIDVAPTVQTWRYDESLHYVEKIKVLMVNYN